jgi:hypothetical protein
VRVAFTEILLQNSYVDESEKYGGLGHWASGPMEPASEKDIKNRSYGPEDSGSSKQIRWSSENVGGMSWEEILEFTQLHEAGTLKPEQQRELMEQAKEKALNDENMWSGMTATECVRQAVASAKRDTLGEYHLNARDLVKKPDNNKVIRALEEIKEHTIILLRGSMMERLVAFTEPEGLGVREIVTDEYHRPILKGAGTWQTKSVSELFGGTRKDLIMTGLVIADKLANYQTDTNEAGENFLTRAAKELSIEGQGITEGTVRVVMESITAVNLDYNNQQAEYRKTKGNPFPASLELYKKEIYSRFDGAKDILSEKNAVRVVNYIENWAYGEIDRDSSLASKLNETILRVSPGVIGDTYQRVLDKHGANPTPQETDKAITEFLKGVTKKQEQEYLSVTVSDSWGGEQKTIRIVREVKNYSNQDMDNWMNNIERSLQAEKDRQTTGKDEKSLENGTPEGDLIIRDGLKILHFSYDIDRRNPDHLKLGKLRIRSEGFDPKTERNFAKMANGDQNGEADIPVMLILPKDVTQDRIERAADLVRRCEATNIIFETAEALDMWTVDGVCIQAARNTITERKNNLNAADEKILLLIADNKVWKKR